MLYFLCVAAAQSQILKTQIQQLLLLLSATRHLARCRRLHDGNNFCRRHRRRSSVNFGGHDMFAPKNVWKIIKVPDIYMILARKNIKIPEFLWYLTEKLTKFQNFTRLLPEKMSGFYIIFARKKFSRFLGGGGTCLPCPPPVSYAYGRLVPDIYSKARGYAYAKIEYVSVRTYLSKNRI